MYTYICVYIYIYIQNNTYVCIYVYVYISLSIYIYIYIYTCIIIYISFGIPGLSFPCEGLRLKTERVGCLCPFSGRFFRGLTVGLGAPCAFGHSLPQRSNFKAPVAMMAGRRLGVVFWGTDSEDSLRLYWAPSDCCGFYGFVR